MQHNHTSANPPTTIPFPAPSTANHSTAAGFAAPPDPGAAPNPVARSPRGRQTICSPRVLEMMKNLILETGMSDTAAAEALGMSSTTISRWKKKDPEIACALLEARMGCRVHHLKKIEKHSESDSMRGLRASIWILERLFPGDYAAKMSERFEYRTLEDQRKVREERALLDEDVKWRMEAEAEARAQAAAEAANAAQGAGPEKGASASETDPRNSRNAAESMNRDVDEEVRACQSREPGPLVMSAVEGCPRPTDPERAAALPITRNGEGTAEHNEGSAASPGGSTERGLPLTALRTCGPDSLYEAAPADVACIYSEDDSRNSRNSPAGPSPSGGPGF